MSILVKYPIKLDRSGDIEDKRDPKTGLIGCLDCTQCCHYVAIEIDTPETRDEFDNIRWYLYHPGIEVYVDHDEAWNVLVHSTCEHLQDDGRCGVYETRPHLCREFSEKECEPNTGEPAEAVLLRNAQDLDDWMRVSRTYDMLESTDKKRKKRGKHRRNGRR